MQILFIEQTKSTPKIEFIPDTNNLLLEGQSYPENSFAFYEPVFTWIESYFSQIKSDIEVNVNVKLSYFNTSSSKCIMMLLDRFEKEFKNGKRIRVNWYYDIENENALESGEEFKEELTLPFNVIAVR